MFDIGFAELLIIGVVGLLVIGPERLPGAIRTGSAWLNRFRRGFNDIKQEVQQELHNDAVLRELRESGEKLRRETEALQRDFTSAGTGDGITGKDAAREVTSEDDSPSAAQQSAGHRETPAPFMRGGQDSATTAQTDDAKPNAADATPGGANTDAADDSSGDHSRESSGRTS